MDTRDIGDLCKDVAGAAEQVSDTFRQRFETVEVLDRFWCLQDTLSRLLEAVSSGNGSYVIAAPCQGLIKKVIEVLKTAEVFHFSSIPAVKSACAAINRSLVALEHSREQLYKSTATGT